MSATMKAAMHLGENYKDNMFTFRSTDFKALKTLFDITQKPILNQKHEIKHVSRIEWQFTPWARSTLLHDKVIKLSEAKVHVYSDSFLCLVKMHRHPEAEEQLQYFQNSKNTKNYLEYFPKTHNSGNYQRDSDENDNLQTRT